MIRLFHFFLLVLALMPRSSADMDEPTARLLLYKATESDPVVEGKDFQVTYKIINTGNAVATAVEVTDRYDPNSFETKDNVNEEGNVNFELDELVPGGEALFNITVKPKLYGVYESTRAKIKYGSGAVEMEGVEPDYRNGYSTSLGRIKIISAAEFERSSSYHLREWCMFGLLYAVPTFIPFLLWLSANSATAAISTRRKTA